MEKFLEESKVFDRQSEERIQNGLVPDLRNLQHVDWFYNNAWRDPEFFKISMMPRVNFVLDIIKNRPKESKIIELGCGYGYLSLEIARLCMDVLGVDISSKSIEMAKNFSIKPRLESGFGQLNYICNNIMSMELSPETFDVSVFFFSLHHIPNTLSVVNKIYGSLKKEGSIILVEPIRNKFTRYSAEFAAIIRILSPTWISYDKKISGLDNSIDWNKYVDDIYKEYMYEGEYMQSEFDNICSSDLEILNSLKESGFEILSVDYEGAFVDKLIGGLRGDYKYVIAKFLKFLDDEMVRKNILPPTIIRIHAIKK